MRTIFFFSICFIFFLSSSTAHAATLQTEFTTLVSDNKLSTEKQSVCIESADKKVLLYNADMRVIPASVSKLYTFDFALATLPADFRYTTTFSLNKTTLYINGGGDPHFVKEHLALVLNRIYEEKKVRITTIVFTPDFYFNWQRSQNDVFNALRFALATDKTLPVAKTVHIIPRATPYGGSGTAYVFSSEKLPILLKQINNYSTNISADVLFARLGGSTTFAKYMKETYGADDSTIHFETGSGLSGNYTTCALTLRVIKHLEQTLEDRGLSSTDLLSMPRVDPGVLKNRFINTDGKNAIVAKSGFINYHHTLAGIINTSKAPAYFAIFTSYNYMAQTGTVKSIVDDFTEAMLYSYRKTLQPFTYTPKQQLFSEVLIRKV